MGKLDTFTTWGRNSRLYKRYTDNARDQLRSDNEFQQALDEWEQFFINSHGDIFGTIDIENPRETIFIDSLYYDFVVDQIIEFAEDEFGFRLINQEPHANTSALSFDFQSLHEKIVDVNSVGRNLRDHITRDHLQNAETGFLRDLYEGIISHKIRLALGEYYTPKGVAELAIDELNGDAIANDTFLDPGCGSGVFVATCVERKVEKLSNGNSDSNEVLEKVLNGVYGIDLNPVAVKSTKLSYILALLPVLESADSTQIELPVFLTDSLRLTRDDTLVYNGNEIELTVDHLVGNPPWITWGNLSDSVKDSWREKYIEKLNLLPHRGVESRLGHGNDDISVPFIWVCIHHYLRESGSASFVLKRDIMKGPAGKLFRTQKVNDRPVSAKRINDFNKLRPFGDDVGVHSAIYTLVADESVSFPIPTTSWSKTDSTPDYSSINAMRESLAVEKTGIVPVESDDTASSWVREDTERKALGDCEHDIRHGVKDDATDVYTIKREELSDIEPDHVYPYIKSKHVVKYGLFGHELHLIPVQKANEDNEEEMKNQYPKTYEYLQSNRERLENRSSTWLKQGTFYNVFGLGDYTWSEYKVVWCRLGFKPHFAVISTVEDEDLGRKMVIPGDHFMFISTDNKYEAHFLCALLNSAVYQRSIRGVASEGKASLSKTVISKLELPEYQETEESMRLAELSMKAHDIVPEYTDVSKRKYNKLRIDELEVVQAKIDEIVEEMLAEESLFPDVGQSTLTSF